MVILGTRLYDLNTGEFVMSRTNWKGLERKVAGDLGVERNSKKCQGESGPDVIKDFGDFRVIIECKNRNSVDVDKDLSQAEEYCNQERDIPLLVFRETGKKSIDVFIKLSYFKKLYKKVKEKGSLFAETVLQLRYEDFVRMMKDL
ncbi:hypothetical protein LCGC14_0616880 [marine sediment metagenome]|uniref:Uncharacterized protein n=1 Tax=marine sediment metagenome TaxID=412755 RepID=A0A0F9TSD4_9ZZZZ